MKIKVLHVINTTVPGGAETLLLNSLSPGGLCEYTENHLAFFMVQSYLLDRLDKNVKVHFLNYKGATDIFRLLRVLRKIIRDNKFDIIHTHLNPADVYSHIACPPGVPQVHTMHTTYSMDNETSPLRMLMEKYIYLKGPAVNLINLSDYTRQDFLKSFPFKGESFVLNNFVADDFFNINKKTSYEGGNELKLIAIGTLKPLKNFEYLLEVFKGLKDYNISLDIYGGGDTTKYQEIIDTYNLRVRMMGHSTSLKDLLPLYDMFIMPSKFEGFPLSIFEAMAAGVPVMVSDIPPLKSIIKENGIYFDLNNPSVVVQILLDIFNNKTNINVLASNAKLYAEKTVRRDVYIRKLLNIYEVIIEKNKHK